MTVEVKLRRFGNVVMWASWIIADLVIWAFWGVPEHVAGPYVAIAGVIIFIGFAARYLLDG
jgi:hypothetical protein